MRCSRRTIIIVEHVVRYSWIANVGLRVPLVSHVVTGTHAVHLVYTGRLSGGSGIGAGERIVHLLRLTGVGRHAKVAEIVK